MKEKEKHRKHGRSCKSLRQELVPFVCDSYGVMGEQAWKYLKKISGEAKQPFEWMDATIRRLSCSLQRGNAAISDNGVFQSLKKGSVDEACVVAPRGMASVEAVVDGDEDVFSI